MGTSHLFTSECVGAGHPDKLCDQVSDAIVDAIFAIDPKAHIACETAATTGQIIIMGEVKTSAIEVLANAAEIARETVAQIGYTDPRFGIDAMSCGVLNALHSQSPDIDQGVDRDEGEQGAGDQGMMFGYACDETPELMPLPVQLSRQITNRMWDKRQSGEIKWMRPDCKSQVTVEYDADGQPTRIDTIVVSTQHDDGIELSEIRETVIEEIIKPLLPAELVKGEITYHINPTGRFVIGGPHGDTGLTGRKIIVDTYGGMGRHGGGAFSGKDPSKVDRSAAYATRWLAKNIVAAGLAKRCELQVAYAIGVAEPVSLHVDTFGTGVIDDAKIVEIVRDTVSLTPKSIIERLDLMRPIYLKTARFGHMGREDEEVTWEKRDLVDAFKSKAGL